jgi:hypothetical protein
MGARRLKRVNPGHEPSELQIYREKRPQSTWEEMRSDRDFDGSTAYEVCRQQLINSQGGIIRDIERRKKQERLAGYNAQQGLSNIAKYYMRQQLPGFITTIRLCLGKAVEDHLKKSVEN